MSPDFRPHSPEFRRFRLRRSGYTKLENALARAALRFRLLESGSQQRIGLSKKSPLLCKKFARVAISLAVPKDVTSVAKHADR